MEVPRLGIESGLQLPANTTATEMPDPRHVCDLHHSSGQCQILNPLSKASDQTYILMDTSQFLNPLSHNGNSQLTVQSEKPNYYVAEHKHFKSREEKKKKKQPQNRSDVLYSFKIQRAMLLNL